MVSAWKYLYNYIEFYTSKICLGWLASKKVIPKMFLDKKT